LIANVVKSKNAKYDYGKNEEYCNRSADDFVPPYTLMTAEPSIRDFDSNAHLETAENSLNLDDGGHLLVSPKNVGGRSAYKPGAKSVPPVSNRLVLGSGMEI
jgi:hypothetical protein